MDDRRSALWRDSSFARFCIGRSASFFGTELAHFILPVTAATLLHATPAQMGLLAAAQTTPALAFGLVAGAWADRLPRARLLAAADLVSGVSLGLTPAAAAAGLLSLEALYALVFLLGTLNVLSNVAYQALLPSIAGRGRLVLANSYLEGGGALAETAGPALGGLLLQIASVAGAYLAGGASFLLGGVSALGASEPERGRHERRALVPEIAEGIRFVAAHRGLRWVVLCGCVDNLLGVGLFGPLYVLYATETLGVQPAMLGLIFAVGGAGALAGALIAGNLTGRLGMRGALVVAQLGTGVGRLALAMVGPGGFALLTLFCAEFLVGVTMPLFNINLVSLRQAAADDRMQGRVNATVGALLWTAAPIGGLLGGVLGGMIGLGAVLTASAVLTCVITAVLFLPPAHTLQIRIDA